MAEHIDSTLVFDDEDDSLVADLVVALETLIKATTQPTGPTLPDALAGARDLLARIGR